VRGKKPIRINTLTDAACGMRGLQARPAPQALPGTPGNRYPGGIKHKRSIMFSRIFIRGGAFRRLWAEFAKAAANPGEGRIAGILIAHLGR
jgi:hypothetical protein